MSLQSRTLSVLFFLCFGITSFSQIFPICPGGAPPGNPAGNPDAIVPISGTLTNSIFIAQSNELCIQGDDLNNGVCGEDPEWRLDVQIPQTVIGTCLDLQFRVCRRGDFGQFNEDVFVYDENLTEIGIIEGLTGVQFDCTQGPACTQVFIPPCAFNDQTADGIFSITFYTNGLISNNTVGDFCNLQAGPQMDENADVCNGDCPTYTQADSPNGNFPNQASGGPMVNAECIGCNCLFLDYLVIEYEEADAGFDLNTNMICLGESITITPDPTECPQNLSVDGGTTGLSGTIGVQSFTPTGPGIFEICNTSGNAACPLVECEMVTVFPDPTVTDPVNSPVTCAGTPVDFSAAASGGTSPYTFQWQFSTDGVNYNNTIDGVDYTGSNTANLTVNAPPLVLDGAQYQLIVTDANGCMIVSNPATLNLMGCDPELTIDKMIDPGSPTTVLGANGGITDGGDQIVYVYEVCNTGQVTVTNVGVNDPGPSFNGIPGTNTLPTPICGTTSLLIGDCTTCTATYTLSQTDVDNGSMAPNAVVNSATATGEDPDGDPYESDPDEEMTDIPPVPSLAFAKSISDLSTANGDLAAVTDAGDIITFEYIVTNDGNVTINNIVVNDPGPVFGNPGTPGTNVLSAIVCTPTTLQPGDMAVCSATYIISQADIDNSFDGAEGGDGSFMNTANASGEDPNGNDVDSPDDDAEGDIPAMPALDMEKEAAPITITAGADPNLPDGGDIISYTYTVENTGNVTITNIVVNDPGPTFNGAPGTGTMSTITCVPTTLAPGEIATCTATYTLSQADVDEVAGDPPFPIMNTAMATGEDPNGDPVDSPEDSEESELEGSPMLDMEKSASSPTTPILAGVSTITYTYDVCNTGNVTINNIAIVDDGPAFNGVLGTGSPATVIGADNLGSTAICAQATLIPGACTTCTAIYTMSQDDIDNGAGIPGGVTNTAFAGGDGPNGPVESPDDDAETMFEGDPMLAIDKSISMPLPDPMVAGSVITYNYEVENTGNVTISNVSVNDPGPTFNGANGTNALSAIVCMDTTLDPGEITTCTATYILSQTDIDNAAGVMGGAANIAIAEGEDPSGDPVDSPPDEEEFDVPNEPSLAFEKSISDISISSGADGAVIDAGDIISFEYEVINDGNVTISNIVVNDMGPVFGTPGMPGTNNLSAIICVPTTLDPGETAICTATYILSQADIDNSFVGADQGGDGAFMNTANASGEDPTGEDVDSPDDDAEGDIPANPMLELDKQSSPPTVLNGANGSITDAGDEIVYTYVVENTGNVTINNIMINDPGPNFGATPGTPGANNPLVITCLTTSLAPGETTTCTATYILDQSDVDNAAGVPAGVVNTATSEGEDPTGDPAVSDPDTEEEEIPNDPSLAMEKSASPIDIAAGGEPALIDAGDEITYSYEVCNDGNVTIDNVQINDPGPTFNGLPGDNNATFSTGITCPMTTLAPGECTICSNVYVLTANDIANGAGIPGGVENTANASGTDPSGENVDSPDDSAVTEIPCDLFVDWIPPADPICDTDGPLAVFTILTPSHPLLVDGINDAAQIIWSGSVVATATPLTATNLTDNGVTATFNPVGLSGFVEVCLTGILNDECLAEQCYSFEVIPEPTLPLSQTIDLSCEINTVGSVSLSQLFPGFDIDDPENDDFTIAVAPATALSGAAIVYNEPGCYEATLTYTGSCSPMPAEVTSFVLVAEEPQPSFDIQDQACWNGVDFTLDPKINSPDYFGAPDIVWSLDPTSTGGTVDPVTGQVTINGTGVVMVCLTETISYGECGNVPAGSCQETFCVRIDVGSGNSPAPDFTFPDAPICQATDIPLTGIPLGGVFSGTGVTDNGDGTGVLNVPDVGTYLVTYTVTDATGCSSSITKAIDVGDTSPPDLTAACNALSDLEINNNPGECFADAPDLILDLTAIVNDCGPVNPDDLTANWTLTGATSANGVGTNYADNVATLNVGINTITYTVTNVFGESSTCSKTVTVIDNEAPSIDAGCPADETGLVCGSPYPQKLSASDFTITDNCTDQGDMIFIISEIPNSEASCPAGVPGTWRIYTFIDESGNQIDCRQNISYADDVESPVLSSLPADITDLICSDDVPPAAILTATDNCDPSILVHFSEELQAGSCQDDFTLIRTWTAEDDCGNNVSHTQTIIVSDVTAPVLSAMPADISVQCAEEVPAVPLVTATDNCVEEFVEFSEVISTGICSDKFTLTRTWRAKDDCANEVFHVQVITVDDTTIPVITPPVDIEITCDVLSETSDISLIIQAFLDGATVTDNCSEQINLSNDYDATAIDICGGNVVTVTWTASDDCGNVAVPVSSTITIIEDITPPTLVPPTALTLDCSDFSETTDISTLITSFLTGASATDDCDTDVEISNDFVPEALNVCTANTITVNFTATDACGNSATEPSTITIIPDTNLPVITAPAPLEITCAELSETSDISLLINSFLDAVSVTDDCSPNINIENDYDPSVLDICAGQVITVTWNASDACGNQAVSASSTITIVEDVTPPTLVPPTALTLDCSDFSETTDISTLITSFLTGASATDDCDTDVEITNDYVAEALDVCSANIVTVNFTATDACGNSTTEPSTITIIPDTNLPVITVPAPLEITCAELSETSDISLLINSFLEAVSVTDDCSPNINIENDYDPSVLDICAGQVITVTWNASDACGNQAVSATSTITIVEDVTPPTLVPPTALTLDCSDFSETTDISTLITAFLTGASATDDCDTDVEITNDYVAEALDVCSANIVTVNFTATDACGNSTTEPSTITIIPDTDIPIISAPTPIEITCEELSETSDISLLISSFLEGASVTDNCSDDIALQNDYDPSVIDICAGQIITVTWTATDACGNQAVPVTSTINVVEDNEAPILVVPDAVDIACEIAGFTDFDVLISAFILGATAEDNCDSDPEISTDFSDDDINICEGGVITINFTATDACGNSVTIPSTITIMQDDNEPVIIPPAPIEITCAELSETSDPYLLIQEFLNGARVVDDCDPNLDLVNDFSSNELNICSGGVITVNWGVTDICGNVAAIASSTITIVEDDINPIIVPPAPVTLSCADISETVDPTAIIAAFLGGATATDNCDTDPEITTDFSGESLDICSSNTITVNFTATDACGNSATLPSTITIVPDVEVPVVIAPSDLNLDCSDINETSAVTISSWLNSATVSDNCDPNITVTNDYNLESLEVCAGGVFTVTWTAEDACGNISTDQAILTITPDTGDPILTVPEPLVINCESISAVDDPSAFVAAFLTSATATDLCDTDPVITHDYNGTTLNICEAQTITVTWTAVDACQNSMSASSTITIIPDTENPVIPISGTLGGGTDFYTCEASVSIPLPVATDDCSLAAYNYFVTDPAGNLQGPFDLSLIDNAGGTTADYSFTEGVSILSYYAEDACGNSTIIEINVNIIDDDDPYFADCPTNITVANDPDQCQAFVNWDTPIAFDNCDRPEGLAAGEDEITVIQLSGPFSGTAISVGTHTVVYEATDDDGNSVQCSFNIIVEDTECPEFIATMPEDIEVDCDKVPEPFEVQPQWHTSDNCTDAANVIVDFEEIRSDGNCPFNYDLKRIWTITDEAGNACEHKQKISVIDTMAPTLIIPEDTTIESCDFIVTIDTTIIQVNDTLVDSLIIINDLWVQTKIQLKKDSMIIDTLLTPIDPTIGFLPEVHDNCSTDQDLIVTITEETEFICKGDKAAIVTRIYEVMDECGNIAIDSQRIEVIDPNPPVLTVFDTVSISLGLDGHVTLTKNELVKNVFDGCFSGDNEIDIDIKPNYFNCQDIGQVTVLVAATDPCNNKTSYEEVVVNIIDDTAPVLYCPVNPVIININPTNCDNQFGAITDILAGNDCDVVISTDPPLNAGIDISTSSIIVTATDASGNSESCTIPVTINLSEPIDFESVLSCNDRINISLNNECWYEITPDVILEGSPNICTDLLCIEVEDSNGNDHLNFFDESDIGEVFKVKVVDCNGSENSCWGEILLEEKQIPIVEWPADTTLLCVEPTDPDYFKLGFPEIVNCESDWDYDYEDIYSEFGECASPRATIERRWVVNDDDGNVVRDTQFINIIPFSTDHVRFPADLTLENPVDCSKVTESVFDIENGLLEVTSVLHPDSTGRPDIFGLPLQNDAGLCLFSMGYRDEVLDICGGSFQILRKWTLNDVCGEGDGPISETQIITVYDVIGPEVLDVPVTIELSINPWQCTFSGILPFPDSIKQSCGNILFEAYVTGEGAGYITTEGSYQEENLKVVGVNIDKGVHWVTYVYKDGCSNIDLFKYQLVIGDDVDPTAVCPQEIIVSLTGNNEDGGSAKLYAEELDAGSQDSGCGTVETCLIRKVDFDAGAIGLIDGKTAYLAMNDCHYDGERLDTIFDKLGEIENIVSVPFVFCKDELKFCCSDLGPQEVVLIATDESGLTSSCTTTAIITDKSVSQMTCTPYEIDCIDDKDVNILSPIGSNSTCGGDLSLAYVDDSEFLNSCGEGQIFRIWYIDDNENGTLDDEETNCNQVITVVHNNSFDPYSIKWPKHYTGEIVSGVNLECNDDGELNTLFATVQMGDVFTCIASEGGQPAWCNTSCGLVGLSSEVDTIVASDACLKLIKRWTVIDWCYWEANGGEADDQNDGANDSFEAVEDWAQGNCYSCEGGISDDAIYFRYENVDLDGYYTYDQVLKVVDDTAPIISLADLLVNTSGGATSKNDNSICTGIGVFEAQALDFCGDSDIISESLKWIIEYDNGIETTSTIFTGSSISMETQDGSPGDIHSLSITVTDGCNNSTSSNAQITFIDQKKPVPLCVSGVTTAFMQSNGSVAIWAKDFDLGSFDNCSDLQYSIVSSGQDPIHPYDEGFGNQSNLEFSCDDLSQFYELDVWIWDSSGNGDFCTVGILISGECSGETNSGVMISGSIKTELGDPIQDVFVALSNAELNEYPKTLRTENDGQYAFNSNPVGFNYTIEAIQNEDVLNGVSTVDLFLLQKHVLGVQILESPYKMIAGDANGDQKLSAADILDIRKVILGLTERYTSNKSWTFIDKSNTFIDQNNPWPYIDYISYSSLESDQLNSDFVGIKIGDLSDDAIPNGLLYADTRSTGLITLMVEDQKIKKGQNVSLTFSSKDFDNISGFQFTLSHKDLQFSGLKSQEVQLKAAENIGVHSDALTFSWNHSEPVTARNLFTLEFIALADGAIIDMVDIGSIITKAEMYRKDSFDTYDIDLEFDYDEEHEIQLFQNDPNPFSDKTNIKFVLPESADINLSIFHVNGSLIKSIKGSYSAGQHNIILDRKELNMSGILYYQLRVGDKISDIYRVVVID